MSANGLNTTDDADMAECDGEKVVTMMDVLQEQQDFEDNANAVLGASDDKNCTYNKGYIKRQAIYVCLTCCTEAKDNPTKRAGVCLACSLTCHENHELIELYTKRNFRCDCGNPKFNSHPCTYTPIKMDFNDDNSYNQNFSGLYCVCHRPYPDPESTFEDEMIQCIICEDWLHSSHLDTTVPNNDLYSEMICKACMEKNEFLYDYSHLAVNVETGNVDVITVNGNGSNISNDDLEQAKIVNDAKGASAFDKGTKPGQDADMTEEFNKKSEDTTAKNTDALVPKKINMQESIESTTHDKTGTKNNIVDNQIELQNDVAEVPNSREISDIPMEGAQIVKTETQAEDNVTATNTQQEAKTEQDPITSAEVNGNEQIHEKAVTKIDKKEETPVTNDATDSPVNAGEVQTKLGYKISVRESFKEPDQSITDGVSVEQNTVDKLEVTMIGQKKLISDKVESEENSVTVETPNTYVDENDSILENTTADLIKKNLDDDKNIVQALTIENEILDEPKEIEATRETAIPENDTASSRNVGEKIVDPTTSNDAIGDSEFIPIPKIKSQQVTEKAQLEVEQMDTLEAATKELSDMMEDSNQGNAEESAEESIKDNISQNTDKTTETQINNKSDSNVITIETEPGSTENMVESTESENKFSNESDSEFKSLTNGDEANDSTNIIDEGNFDGKICSDIDSITENKTKSASEIEMIETCQNEPSHHENKMVNDSQSNSENEHKRKLEDNVEFPIKRPKLDPGQSCIRPRGIKRIHKGATFWPSHFRQKICTCNECLSMYKDLSVLFLVDPEDTVSAYETLGKERIDGGPTTQYEKGLQALSSLDRIQQINALTEYNKMRDKLLDFLKSFKDRKEIVKEDDIKAFFAGMKPRREPDGVYFCR